MIGSLRVRLLSGYLTMACFLALLWVVALLNTTTLSRTYTHAVRTVDVLSSTIVERNKVMADEESGLRGYLLTESPVFLQPWTQGRQALPQLDLLIDQLALDDPGDRGLSWRWISVPRPGSSGRNSCCFTHLPVHEARHHWSLSC